MERYWGLIIEAMLKDLIDVAGGPEVTARKMAERGCNPVVFAIMRCGGMSKAAELMGCSRQTMHTLMSKPVSRWRLDWADKLSTISDVPLDLLKKGGAVREDLRKVATPPNGDEGKLKPPTRTTKPGVRVLKNGKKIKRRSGE